MNDYHFISYSSADAAEFAVKVADALSAGPPVIHVWLDKRELKAGSDWDVQIARAIGDCKSLLYVMTRDSVEDKSECAAEWRRALHCRKPVVPILLAEDVDAPFRLSGRQYIDFRGDFQAGIARLRQHLEWLDSPEGQVRALRDLLDDKRRAQRRTTAPTEAKRIQGEIGDIERMIAELEEARTAGIARMLREPGDDPEQALTEEESLNEEITGYTDIYAFGTADPPPDVWYKMLRPVLHQAAQYSVPTYYLDTNLKIIDWNVAFELIFSDLVGKVRHKHVNWFIIRLENREEVFEHARRFTEDVRKGALPLVDMEPIRYTCKYGKVLFEKVAAQLHDRHGKLCGWSVALIIREIKWSRFLEELREKLWQDRLWAVYSHSYDPVLLAFPPYRDLISAVTSYVPGKASHVVDLGAGSGNCTEALVKVGHHVTAVESNLSMLERFRAKRFGSDQVTVVKGSVEHLDCFDDRVFDAAIMMNVLYAVDEPLRCLKGIHRILTTGGVLSFSTTHADVGLKALLDSIRKTLIGQGKFEKLRGHYENLREANEEIERTIACRFTREEYIEWTEAAGFELLEPPRDTYEGAVMLVHARKK